MSFICRACSEIYSDTYGHDFNDCPKEDCNGEEDDFIYVNDIMAPIAAEFNRKGFEIECVDMGSPINNMYSSRITFSEMLLEIFGEDNLAKKFDNLPDSWRFVIYNDTNPMIETKFFCGNRLTRTKQFIKAHLDLAEFVESAKRLEY